MIYAWILVSIVYIILTHWVAKYMGEKRNVPYGKIVAWSLLFTPVLVALFIKVFVTPIEK